MFADGGTRSVVVLPSARNGRGVHLPGWRCRRTRGRSRAGRPSVTWAWCWRGSPRSWPPTRRMVGPGQAFAVGPGHDGWVVGDRPVIALDVATPGD